ncbi:hypothetical protein AB0B10_25785 [Micromonospora arborensis]|uniref:hypothetical protein n=1 Tax=Micromonospora arborensis TaxID=2116518 RepID=UPI0033D46F59
MSHPYARAHLIHVLHTLSDDGTCVITAQRWQDPQHASRQWLVVLRNGKHTASAMFTGRRVAELDAELSAIRAAWEQHRGLITEEQARAYLASLTGEEPQSCQRDDCGEVLPLGRSACQACGAAAGRVAAGLISGARRRGTLVMPTR